MVVLSSRYTQGNVIELHSKQLNNELSAEISRKPHLDTSNCIYVCWLITLKLAHQVQGLAHKSNFRKSVMPRGTSPSDANWDEMEHFYCHNCVSPQPGRTDDRLVRPGFFHL